MKTHIYNFVFAVRRVSSIPNFMMSEEASFSKLSSEYAQALQVSEGTLSLLCYRAIEAMEMAYCKLLFSIIYKSLQPFRTYLVVTRRDRCYHSFLYPTRTVSALWRLFELFSTSNSDDLCG